MQLHTTLSKVTTNVDSPAKTFTINASQKAFKILSSNLYQNKIQAIIRELSTNAADSHKAAGNKDPFEVHLPSNLEAYFNVRDFGTGMTEESIYELYTSYFSSSKTDSDEYIGALGLGSKSPFSYVDSFTLESIIDGEKKLYSAFLSSDGLPQILPISTEKTESHSGISISFPVQVSDISNFMSEAARVYFSFDTLPKFVGASASKCSDRIQEYKTDAKISLQTSEWVLYSSKPGFFKDSYSSSAYAKMGSTLYPIEGEYFKNPDTATKFVLGNNFVLNIPLGVCDIAPSREALSYDKETLFNLSEIFAKVYNEFATGTIFQSIIDSDLSLWDRSCKLTEIVESMKVSVQITFVDKKSGKTVTAGGSTDCTLQDPCQTFYLKRNRRGSRLESTSEGPSNKLAVTMRPSTAVMVGKTSAYFLKRVKEWLRKSQYKYVILFFKELSAADLETLGNPKVLDDKVLPKANHYTSSSKAREVEIEPFGTGLVTMADQDVRYIVRKYQSLHFMDLETLIKEEHRTDLYSAIQYIYKYLDKGLKVAIVPHSLVKVVQANNKTWKPLTRAYMMEEVKKASESIKEYLGDRAVASLARSLMDIPFMREHELKRLLRFDGLFAEGIRVYEEKSVMTYPTLT